MKIGIVTITRGENYGNRLQNYASQIFIEKECPNAKVETFHNMCGEKNFLFRHLKNILKHTVFINKYKSKLRREKIFDDFNKNNINFSQYYLNNNKSNSKIIKEYKYFIAGSDQIWNPNYSENAELHFLHYIPKNKSIAFAPSFGVSEIPNNRKENISEWINEFRSLSVREDAGKKIVEELTERTDVEVLVDPTMLLTAEEWDKVSKRPKQLDNLRKDKYILNYFLGELSEKRKKEIEKVAEENDCEIINILDKNNPFYETGPSEFLYLEKNAFLICTDSFHSSVFAILYNRPFIVFKREDKTVDMNSRIETLLSKFDLKERFYNGKIDGELLKNDYTKAYEILDEERKKSENFLKKALDIKE